MTYQLIAQISTGPKTGYPVVIGTFDSEAQVKAAYRQAMKDKLDGGYSEDVKDFAIQAPRRERTAEEANVANALMAQMQLL